MRNVVDGLALRHSERFGADASPGSSFTIPNSVPPFKEGDLCWICQLAESPTAIPTGVTPTGFTTAVSDTAGGTQDGKFCRVRTSHKILIAADFGTTFGCMVGPSKLRVCGIVLGFNRGLRAVEYVSSDGSYAAGGLTNIFNLTWDGKLNGAFLWMAFGHGEFSLANYDLQFKELNPEDAPLFYGSEYFLDGVGRLVGSVGGVSTTRTYYAFKRTANFNAEFDTTVSVRKSGDSGTFNATSGALVKLR